ncbi:hypothetical protein OSTOST_14322, partial [Ostertagia ostertagi]
MDDSETSVTDLSVSPESVAIAVGGGGVGGMQICPSIMLGSTQFIRSALLIGVPSENISGSAVSGAAPPILLSPSNDKRPLPAVIFAGASLMALGELLVYVENGIPIIVLQDSCELCVVLHSAYLLYRSAQFEHSKFVTWLEEQLDAIAIGDVATATITAVKIFATAFGDTQLIDCRPLPSRIIELCLQCHSGSTEARQLLQLATHINEPSILNGMDLEELLDDE